MKLFFRKLGKGQPFIILHGLYGSSDNWVSIARELSANFEVWLIDLRNHGHSPHSKDHNYGLMAEDLYAFIAEHQLIKPILLGHSMGGKTAMYFADKYPELLSHLIIIDIAPKSYLFSIDIQSDTLNHKQIMEGMLAIDFSRLKKREDLNKELAKFIPNEQIRQFLMKNIKRNHDMSFGWILNIEDLYENINNILDGFKPTGNKSIQDFPVLFVKGAESEYITSDDLDEIKSFFPNAKLEIIPHAGHWLHVQQPELLIKKLKEFLV